jgi:hypothetical protein
MDPAALPKPTATEFKELLIEFYLKKWDREPPDLSTDNQLEELESLVVFDVKKLESNEGPLFFSGPDLDTTLAAARRDMHEEQYLKTRLGSSCNDKALMAETMILLDEELKEEGLSLSVAEAAPMAVKVSVYIRMHTHAEVQ